MKTHNEIARQFGQSLAIRRSAGNADLSATALSSAFWSLAETLTNDYGKVKPLAVAAKAGFDQISKQNGWKTFNEIYEISEEIKKARIASGLA